MDYMSRMHRIRAIRNFILCIILMVFLAFTPFHTLLENLNQAVQPDNYVAVTTILPLIKLSIIGVVIVSFTSGVTEWVKGATYASSRKPGKAVKPKTMSTKEFKTHRGKSMY